MTVYGWDASNYDDPPTVRDGIDFYTHKAAEGHHNYYDREYGVSLNNANSMGIPILGAYFVNHPGTVNDQVDWFVQILDQDTPWWRKHQCFILQIDAEKFDYMPSAPTKAEIQAFGDRLVNVHGVAPSRVIVYAPQWLYGNGLSGLTYRLWASAYGGNPVGHYKAIYPGDNDGKRWQAYSGQTPMILQYGSNATIGNQTTCDANAYRGTLSQLMTELGAGSGSIIPTPGQLGDLDMYIIYDDGGMKYTYNGIFRMYIDDPNLEAELTKKLGEPEKVANVAAYGVELSKEEWFALKDIVSGLPAQIAAIPAQTALLIPSSGGSVSDHQHTTGPMEPVE